MRTLCRTICAALMAGFGCSPASAAFTFAVLGDNRPAKTHVPPTDTFRTIATEISKVHPGFVITTGDLIHGDKNDPEEVTREYDDVMPIVKLMGVPVHFVPGNHEIAKSAADEALYRKRVDDQPYSSFNYANCHFILSDSEVVGQEEMITAAQYTWLEKDLNENRGKFEHVFAAIHEPPYPVSRHIGSSLDVHPTERDRLVSLLKEYRVDALICGHEHLYDDQVHEGLRQIISGGAGAPLHESPHGGSFHHYLLITVDGPRVTVKVVKPAMKPN